MVFCDHIHLAEVTTRNTPPNRTCLQTQKLRHLQTRKNLQNIHQPLGTLAYTFNHLHERKIHTTPSLTTRVTERSLLPQWRPCFLPRFRTDPSPRWRQPTSPRSRDIGVWWSTMETPGGWIKQTPKKSGWWKKMVRTFWKFLGIWDFLNIEDCAQLSRWSVSICMFQRLVPVRLQLCLRSTHFSKMESAANWS